MKYLDQHTQTREEIERTEKFQNTRKKENGTNRFKYSPKTNFKSNSHKNNYNNYNKNNYNSNNFSKNFNQPERFKNQTYQTSAMVTKTKSNQNSNNNNINQLSTTNDHNENSSDSSSKFNKNLNCKFCEGKNHITKMCSTYDNVKKRNERARELKLCLNCLNKGHHVNDCLSKYRCFLCKGKHNTVLCRKNGFNNKFSNKTKINFIQENENEDDTTNIFTVNSHSTELLMTIEVPVSDLIEQNKTDTVILFDNGSQKTYITNNLAEKLMLPTLNIKNLEISTFSNESTKIIPSRTVQLKIKTKNNNYELINAQTIEKITDLTTISLNKNSNSNQNKIYIDKKEPELLIGVDHYWDLMIPHQTLDILPSGFYRIKTKIGDIISGKGNVEFTKIQLANAKKKEQENINEICKNFGLLRILALLIIQI